MNLKLRLVAIGWVLLLGCGRSTPYRPAQVPVVPPPPVQQPCALTLLTPVLDFGSLAAGDLKELEITVRNDGLGACEIQVPRFTPSTSPSFSMIGLDPLPVTIEPNGDEVSYTVRFTPGPPSLPMLRTGTVTIETRDPKHPLLLINLKGSIKLCNLEASPGSIDFGNVTLNATATSHLTLTNQGLALCDLSRIIFGDGTDSNFHFPVVPGATTLAPGGSTTIEIDFKAATSTEPFERSGSVLVDSNDLLHPELVVPLSAFISTVCTQAGQFIYTVDSNGIFARFDPTTLMSVDIATLNCPTGASPFSMNVDQKGFAWVVFDDGGLFKVDTATAACTQPMYTQGQHGFTTFGMGSVFDSSTGIDTLYLSNGMFSGTSSGLGTLSFPGLIVTPVATVQIGWLELAGTGDGQLWAYAPNGGTGGLPLLARLNRTTGAVIDQYNLPEIDTVGGFAVKFFGGNFFIFVGPDVWKISRSALVPGKTVPTVAAKRVLTTPGRDVVGAGVSTCAPVQN